MKSRDMLMCGRDILRSDHVGHGKLAARLRSPREWAIALLSMWLVAPILMLGQFIARPGSIPHDDNLLVKLLVAPFTLIWAMLGLLLHGGIVELFLVTMILCAFAVSWALLRGAFYVAKCTFRSGSSS